MKLSDFKSHLEGMQSLSFIQPNGSPVPAHFHITEAGVTAKHFIDCGGTERVEKYVSFQLWVADDVHHRLAPSKLMGIIEMANSIIGNDDPEVEVEYQGVTIGRFGIDADYGQFMLTPKLTNCLAMDRCGIPEAKPKMKLSEINTQSSCCTPGGGCC
jgi:hypothetical protein